MCFSAVIHSAAVNLKVVFLPLLAFEIIILIDNFRYYADMFLVIDLFVWLLTMKKQSSGSCSATILKRISKNAVPLRT